MKTFEEWVSENSDGYGLDVGALPSEVAEAFARRVWDAAALYERERWADVVRHAANELEAIDDMTAQSQAEALRALLNEET